MQDLSTKRSAKSRSFWTKRSSARPSGCTTRRCADLWLIYRTPRACPLLSRPQEILHDRARNLDRLCQSKEPRNDQKVNAATERAGYQNAHKAGISAQDRNVQIPTGCQAADGSDELWTHGADDQVCTYADGAARIVNGGYGHEGGCNDARRRHALGTKGQAGENPRDLSA